MKRKFGIWFEFDILALTEVKGMRYMETDSTYLFKSRRAFIKHFRKLQPQSM